MKIKELISKLKEQDPEFEVEASCFERDNSKWGVSLKQYKVECVADIGVSEKVVILSLLKYEN
jgi:hypothetical protein